MHERDPLRTTPISLLTAGTLGALLLGAPAAAAPPSDPVRAGAAFLAAAFEDAAAATDSYGPGTTADAISALVSTGYGADVLPAMSSALEAVTPAYVRPGAAFRPGQTGKVLLAVAAVGADPTDFAGLDLVAGATSTQDVDGVDSGYYRGPSSTPPSAFDQSVFNHTLTQLGLEAAGGASASVASATDFLLTQQCADGSFAGGAPLVVDGTCTEADFAGPDATALSVLALVGAVDSGAVADSVVTGPVAEAVAYLEGAAPFGGANTAGLALQALLAAGEDASAAQVRGEVVSFQYGGAVPGQAPAGAPDAATRGGFAGFDDSLGSTVLATNQALPGVAAQHYPVAPGTARDTPTQDAAFTAAPVQTAAASPGGATGSGDGTTEGEQVDLETTLPATGPARGADLAVLGAVGLLLLLAGSAVTLSAARRGHRPA